MWNPGAFLSLAAALFLAALLAGGCAARQDPFEHQVARVDALERQGTQLFSQGDYSRACRNFSRALELSRAVDYPPGVAQQLNNLGAVALETGDLTYARELFTQAWTTNQVQRQWGEAAVNQANLATVAEKQAKWEEAAQHLALAEEAAVAAKSSAVQSMVLAQRAGLLLDQNRVGEARYYLDRAQKLAATPATRGAVAHQWGRFYLAAGDSGTAFTHFGQALDLDRSVLDRHAMAADLFYLGEVSRLRGNFSYAWDYYRRAYDMYVALKKPAQVEKCRVRLTEVNRQGRLGRDLPRPEPVPCPSPS